MANLTLTASNQLLSWALGLSATGPSGALQVALVTANGTTSAAGTEVTGGSYTRKTLVPAVVVNGASSNSTDLVWAGMPGVTVVGVEIWDSAATPVRWWFGALTAPKSPDAGDEVRLTAGTLTVALS
ncbi:hypothetical protein ABZT43_12245 [Streptomyces sp. NPDC005349]|uniref:phage tail fiber protein n=1 Tax=Streptomyces sp. NPDC005349 TaxID=3157037 RepID=UPI0033A641D1